MSRNQRATIGKETVEIAERGWYAVASGRRVDIAAWMSRCLQQTTLYRPAELDNLLKQIQPPETRNDTAFKVTNETTLAAARRFVVEHGHQQTLCLNFASAKNPGGGFLGGSQAQEESLARSSGLYPTLQSRWAYYEANRECGTALYTDHMILSPNVPVFRDDEGELLVEPYCLTILTAPAVNAGAILDNELHRESLIASTMATRIAKVLTIAAHHRFEHLILGAWGCGVFRNSALEIAGLFAAALREDARCCHRFRTVTFAVLDRTEQNIIGPFRQHFL